jgi:hypothetical protein
LRDQWVDAPEDDELLEELLENAKQQVIAYARKSVREAYEAATDEEPFDVPANLRLAQRRQVENLWTAGKVDTSGNMGPDSFVRTTHPLDWHVKQIIRPRSAVPIVR